MQGVTAIIFLYFIGLPLNNMFFSVGAALHNLGQFYFVLRKLEQAHNCYEVTQPAFLSSFFPRKLVLISVLV